MDLPAGFDIAREERSGNLPPAWARDLSLERMKMLTLRRVVLPFMKRVCAPRQQPADRVGGRSLPSSNSRLSSGLFTTTPSAFSRSACVTTQDETEIVRSVPRRLGQISGDRLRRLFRQHHIDDLRHLDEFVKAARQHPAAIALHNSARTNLLKIAVRRVIDADRIVFADRAERSEEHRGRLKLADMVSIPPSTTPTLRHGMRSGLRAAGYLSRVNIR